MTEPKSNLAREWLAAERLLAEQAEQLAHMSDEDFDRTFEQATEGATAPATAPTADETLAGVRTRLRAKAGSAPSGAATEAWERSSDANRAPVPRSTWLMAAAFALVAGAVGYLERGAIVAALRGKDTSQDPQTMDPTYRRQLADADRRLAQDACNSGKWDECELHLNEAQKLDPASDAMPTVMVLRGKIESGRHGAAPETGPDGKPKR